MDEKSLPDLFSKLIPDELEDTLGLDQEVSEGQNNLLIASLKAAAGQSGGLVEKAVNEFLNGEGELLDATHAAFTRGRATAESEIAVFLTTRFKISPFAAKLVAMLLVKLFPSIGKLTGAGAAKKKKPRRNKKPKTSGSKKPISSSKKKPKKKTHPETASSKPAKKKKPSAKASKEDAAPKKKPKKKTRTAADAPE